MDNRNLFQKLFGYCPYCEKWFCIVKTSRQASAYLDDSQNWFTGCKSCEKINDEYWESMWRDCY